MGNVLESCGSSGTCCQYHSLTQNQTLTAKNKENEDSSIISVEKEEEKCPLPQDILKIPIRGNSLIIERSSSPFDFYEVLETIGTGSFAEVKKVCLKNNPETIRAMKIIPRKYLLKGINDVNLSEEIFILKNLDHPNIIKLYEFYFDYENIYLISEYCDQGDLLTKIEKLGTMNQIVVKFIMNQVFNAIAYLHSRGVLHGDIKLENIMLYTTVYKAKHRFTVINRKIKAQKRLERDLNNYYNNNYKSQLDSQIILDDITNYEIKLIDFGCSRLFSKKKHKKISGMIGTSFYCSPEVINNLYDEKCDEWSCGVLMYILLTGKAPFSGQTDEEIYEKIKKCEYSLDSPLFENVNENCKDLIRKLLEPNIKKRIKASDALKHPFFQEEFDSNKALTENKDLSVLEKIYNVKPSKSKFHESIIAFLCINYINKDEEKRLRKIFRYIDKEGKNCLDAKSVEYILKENGYLVTTDKINEIIKIFDSDSNGTIEYQEFLRGVCNKKLLFSDNNLKSTFDCIDRGRKGFITTKDIKTFIFKDNYIDDRIFDDYLEQFGMENGDILSFNEFADLIKKNKKLNGLDEGEPKKKDLRSRSYKTNHESNKHLYVDASIQPIDSSDNNRNS
jgi:calcium-dependent protein kinase